VMGAFDVGLAALADRDPHYADAIYAQGRRQGWQLGGRPFHADDHVIAQAWIWAYARKHDPAMIAPVRKTFDTVIAASPKVSLDFVSDGDGGCQVRWCWCDALFMAPPAWAGLTRTTGDSRYRAYAGKEYWATVARLYDRREHLFYRDSRFIGQRGSHGEKIFWSRGNGWVYAGLARLIPLLPKDDTDYPRYVSLFREMSARIVGLQKPDGYWPVSLLGPPRGTPPETSGTGQFTFGLAWGVDAGLLKDAKYRAAAIHGWHALEAATQPDGKLGWVQPIGAAPDKVTKDDTQLYGVGAFLLAATAVSRIEDGAR
jgi:unsaturated rhamnogalacturonyl hydrolase